jgi:hypothetical protein
MSQRLSSGGLFAATCLVGATLIAGCSADTIARSTTPGTPAATSAAGAAATPVDTTPVVPPSTGSAVVSGVVHDFGVGTDTGVVGAIAGATVRVERMDAQGRKIGIEAQTTSDASGAFRFAGLPPQTFFLTLTAPGYRTSQYVISTRQPSQFISAIMTRGSD